MNLKSTIIAFSLLSLMTLWAVGSANAERTLYLNACQELVSMARTYEARANWHNRVARSLMNQIENFAKLPKNQATITIMDNLFSQYDENRALESKFRELYRKTSAEADTCMQGAQ
ncbi:MAG: hypothetical protein P8182_14980 [Deltaproteobacteria bacterium]